MWWMASWPKLWPRCWTGSRPRVVVESNVKYNDAEDEGTPYGPVKVYGYLENDANIEHNRQKLEEALWHLHFIRELPQPVYRPIADENWMNAWKEHYHPIPIGKKLLVLPAWIKQEDPTRIAIKIDPSMAFGTGTHPSTQLCLQLIEEYTEPNKPVIDIGCGSGILSVAAIKMGASHALGVDIDPESVKATKEAAENNEVKDAIEAGLGSVSEIKNGIIAQTGTGCWPIFWSGAHPSVRRGHGRSGRAGRGHHPGRNSG